MGGFKSDSGAKEGAEMGVGQDEFGDCCLVLGKFLFEVLTVPMGYLVLEFVDFQDFLETHLNVLEEVADFADARFLLGIDFVGFGGPTAESTSGTFLGVAQVALLAHNAVAIENVATTCLVAHLAQVFGNFVFALLHLYINTPVCNLPSSIMIYLFIVLTGFLASPCNSTQLNSTQ
jgi:hypothetical protein